MFFDVKSGSRINMFVVNREWKVCSICYIPGVRAKNSGGFISGNITNLQFKKGKENF